MVRLFPENVGTQGQENMKIGSPRKKTEKKMENVYKENDDRYRPQR